MFDQTAHPLRIGHIGLAAWHRLHVLGVQQPGLDPADGLQQVIQVPSSLTLSPPSRTP